MPSNIPIDDPRVRDELDPLSARPMEADHREGPWTDQTRLRAPSVDGEVAQPREVRLPRTSPGDSPTIYLGSGPHSLGRAASRGSRIGRIKLGCVMSSGNEGALWHDPQNGGT